MEIDTMSRGMPGNDESGRRRVAHIGMDHASHALAVDIHPLTTVILRVGDLHLAICWPLWPFLPGRV